MPKKFDTNPLDPEFPQKAKEAQAAAQAASSAETQKFKTSFDTEEEPTRRYDNFDFAAHQSAFGKSQPIAAQPTTKLNADNSPSRKVDKVGLPENILVALPYIPFYVGLIASILELLFVPKSEAKVRFHAAQGLAAHIAILIVTTILSGIGNTTGLANFANFIFQIVTMIMLIVFAIKAWRGKPVHIESVDDLTEWLEDKIKPRK